jgi:hypothetical protein
MALLNREHLVMFTLPLSQICTIVMTKPSGGAIDEKPDMIQSDKANIVG